MLPAFVFPLLSSQVTACTYVSPAFSHLQATHPILSNININKSASPAALYCPRYTPNRRIMPLHKPPKRCQAIIKREHWQVKIKRNSKSTFPQKVPHWLPRSPRPSPNQLETKQGLSQQVTQNPHRRYRSARGPRTLSSSDQRDPRQDFKPSLQEKQKSHEMDYSDV